MSDSLADWADKELDRIREESRQITTSVDDMTKSEYDDMVSRANSKDRDIEDYVSDYLLYSTAAEEEEEENIVDIINYYIDEYIWDTDAGEGWLESLIKNLLFGEVSDAQDLDRPFWETVMEEVDERVEGVQDVFTTVLNVVSVPMEGLALEFSSLFDRFAEFAGERLEDLLSIPARLGFELFKNFFFEETSD